MRLELRLFLLRRHCIEDTAVQYDTQSCTRSLGVVRYASMLYIMTNVKYQLKNPCKARTMPMKMKVKVNRGETSSRVDVSVNVNVNVRSQAQSSSFADTRMPL